MNANIIAKNFDKHAATYDEYASIPKLSSEMLAELMLKGRNFGSILEIGCGTGTYTGLLRSLYTQSEIFAVDIAKTMVDIAREKEDTRGVIFCELDGENISLDRKFSLITSNVSFQWFSDMEKTFRIYGDMLEKNGTLIFSIYGPRTFWELGEVFSEHFGQGDWISSSSFEGRERIERALSKSFKNIKVLEKEILVKFPSLMDFLRGIKLSGTRGQGLRKSLFLGKYTVQDMEKTYFDMFGGIRATHHILFCSAARA